ncbi:dihydroorotate oxidase catalytic subunit [Wenjunlia vitaminophila]|uniref:Dihydroorotate dehydrogenase n=1 Tax=Wenjunlia vitaminophila TaxID=76728 RepID=A0A0T6LTM3_WENVI|nr:dihydroorotate dehydrogenase [Wenjunlia vitaminophila]KRV49265.1 dihydroorotate oxidase catalytic subunit [Wenjunlia vitaminophila]
MSGRTGSTSPTLTAGPRHGAGHVGGHLTGPAPAAGVGPPARPTPEDARARFFAPDPARVTADLSVRLGSLLLDSPVMPASGCFGPELEGLLPMDRLGAVVTKTVFSAQRGGNAAHRLSETGMGMINSVGIPSPGVPGFLRDVLPRYHATGRPVVVSVGGLRPEEYAEVAEELGDAEYAALEINVSCPNLEHGGTEIGADPEAVARITREVRHRAGGRPVWVKLAPMVASVTEVARAAHRAGAEALVVANSYPGMVVDPGTGRPVLGNTVGGVSGPAVKPLSLRLAWLVAQAVPVPVIGCGGVSTAQDALDYLRVGAAAVQVGTATFARPQAMAEIVRELDDRCAGAGVAKLPELVRPGGDHEDATTPTRHPGRSADDRPSRGNG